MKSYLFVASRAPFTSPHTLELIDTAMVAAVFEHPVRILFRHLAVLGLTNSDDIRPIGNRNLVKVLNALPTYEIEEIYVCESALQHFQIESAALPDCAKVVSLDAQRSLFAEAAVVIGAQG